MPFSRTWAQDGSTIRILKTRSTDWGGMWIRSSADGRFVAGARGSTPADDPKSTGAIWDLAATLVYAWVLTLPAAGLIAALSYWLLRSLFG